MTTSSSGPATVLVVDDDRSLADLYAKWLDGTYDVRTAYGGEEALEAVDGTVDVVLLDRRMPDLSGDEVLEHVRESDHDPRVIMVTAVDPDFDIIEMGFDGYLVKPVDGDELADAIEQALSRVGYDDRLREYFALAEKKSKLEATKSREELEASAEYAALEERLATARERVDDVLAGFDDAAFAAAIERAQTVAALRESEQRYRSMTEDVLDTSRVGTVILDSGMRVVWANAAVARYFGVDAAALNGADYREAVERIAPAVEDAEGFRERILAALEDNASVEEFECHVLPGDGREERWLEHWSKPIETGLYEDGRIEHYYDVTERRARERTLETLHGATRRLIPAETGEAIAGIAVETAEGMLGFPLAACYLWDESSGTLEPVAHTAEMAEAADGLDPIAGDDPVWAAFVDGEERRVEDEPLPAADGAVAALRSRLVLPLGNHGALVVGGAAGDGPEDVFARVLAANAEVALDRAERERRLRERDRQLERQNEQLARLNRINTVIRNIGQALVDASSTAEIQQAVCDRLAGVESYEFVWIGEPGLVDRELTPRAWAGDGTGYLDSITLATDGDEEASPAWTAIRTRTPQVVENILDDPAFERHRAEALNRGFRAVASVPLVYEASVYGVLEVFADRPLAFGDEEREVLAELGETIGHAINAVKRKEALLAGGVVELEFELDDPEDFLVDLAGRAGGRVDLKTVVPGSDGRCVAFFSVADIPPERVRELAERSVAVDDVTLVRETPEECLFKCRLADPAVVTTVAEHGAVPRSVTADGAAACVVLELPRTADVRAFSEAFTAAYPGAELLARRQRTGSTETAGTLQERLDEHLTDRQREVLQAAYFGGYFEWPRESNGEALADALGIAQPTFQQHLRAGTRKLFAALFDGQPPQGG